MSKLADYLIRAPTHWPPQRTRQRSSAKTASGGQGATGLSATVSRLARCPLCAQRRNFGLGMWVANRDDLPAYESFLGLSWNMTMDESRGGCSWNDMAIELLWTRTEDNPAMVACCATLEPRCRLQRRYCGAELPQAQTSGWWLVTSDWQNRLEMGQGRKAFARGYRNRNSCQSPYQGDHHDGDICLPLARVEGTRRQRTLGYWVTRAESLKQRMRDQTRGFWDETTTCELLFWKLRPHATNKQAHTCDDQRRQRRRAEMGVQHPSTGGSWVGATMSRRRLRRDSRQGCTPSLIWGRACPRDRSSIPLAGRSGLAPAITSLRRSHQCEVEEECEDECDKAATSSRQPIKGCAPEHGRTLRGLHVAATQLCETSPSAHLQIWLLPTPGYWFEGQPSPRDRSVNDHRKKQRVASLE
ncbi:hypothetical protein P153DRAFT_352856 [Dothidotthia symphoricarpi CBS 119687]|uniref:Uncharacterized protein n=1 Tax=Dothidotthia symphoricarpi CBS 119687 TaxID=1392245 RepID=A0A6A6AWQ3_9PLEO|nr:uncharacterized protein P153DRAFT_352856 [Dothidotthia symphoricarpi CBS 119687]KAF2134951.1 hypothetical protein P153DRAFT_352856 [Dothidotthia symphoricarpi CBS 119687]